eukprot:XP_001705660.1 Hypothetical protein GL50803_6597 [Giardia lamblia ATCC 50803]
MSIGAGELRDITDSINLTVMCASNANYRGCGPRGDVYDRETNRTILSYCGNICTKCF